MPGCYAWEEGAANLALKRTADALLSGGGRIIGVAVSRLGGEGGPLARLGPKRWPPSKSTCASQLIGELLWTSGQCYSSLPL
jgi:hypothetical protein